MATSIQIKRGATAKVTAYTPLSGELVADTTTNKLYIGDGTTPGGKQIIASRSGSTDGSSAPAGEIGEVITNTVTSVSMTSGTPAILASITLTPGDWDVFGNIEAAPAGQAITLFIGSIGTSSTTLQAFPKRIRLEFSAAVGTPSLAVPAQRVIATTNTTLYLLGQATFASGTCSGSGLIFARRMR